MARNAYSAALAPSASRYREIGPGPGSETFSQAKYKSASARIVSPVARRDITLRGEILRPHARNARARFTLMAPVLARESAAMARSGRQSPSGDLSCTGHSRRLFYQL